MRYAALMILLLLPMHAFGEEQQIRFKHDRSLYADDKGGGLNQPEGVACSKNRLVVADSGNGRLVLYSIVDGEPRGGTEIRLPQVVYPARVAMNTKGDLYVLDARQRKIARLTAEGVFQHYVDLASGPTVAMVVPAGLSLDGNDNLYVLDIGGGRIMVFGDDGKFQRQISLPKEYGFITDLAVDAKGTIFLIDSVSAIVYSNAKAPAVFAPITATLKDDLKFASNIVVDNKGLLFISDQNGGGVLAVNQDGTSRRLFSLGWKEGMLRYPSQLCINPDGDLYVADRANSRIQQFTPLK
ncbi:MAG: NHL repeat-containing protein [Nitrospirae bacterium]|nr:NHL repeat-containing protein [Nitrospirota bacterium]